MASSTNSVPVTHAAYVAVSNGNINCYITITGLQKLRVHVGENLPEPDTDLYFIVQGTGDDDRKLVAGFSNLAGADEIWIRTESGKADVIVVRGDAIFSGR